MMLKQYYNVNESIFTVKNNLVFTLFRRKKRFWGYG